MKFLLALAVCLCLAWVVHAFVFTIYAVPDDGLAPQVGRGDRVIVNRLSAVMPQRGDLLVYTDSTTHYLARVEKLPGDTIALGDTLYRIPQVCCSRCQSTDCRLYLVKTSGGRQLVYRHQIVGRAYPLF